MTLAESAADLTTGVHVLDTRPLALPTTGLRSVGVWDPHLVRTDDGWLAGYVSAPSSSASTRCSPRVPTSTR